MEERFETFTVLITRISRSIKRIKADEMADFELKGPHVSCLYYLSQQDGMTAAELCERCDEDKAAISRSLDDLEKNGYITCASGAGKRYKSPLRLTERGKLVEQKEIRLVSPNFACSGIETLSLPAEVSSAFVLDWDTVIFDVGGDDVGATALGRYHQDFVDLAPGALEVLNVVNIRRPLAGTVEKLLRLQEGMQTHARLQITGMINNTNLATATTEQDLWDGYQMLREVSDLTGIPVSYTTGKKEFLDAFLARNPDPKYVGQPIPIDVYMHRDWDSYIEYGLNTKNPHKDMY